MLEELKKFIQSEKLFQPTQKILLGVSGGVDSTVMAHLFSKAGFEFAIAHVNFQLRGEEANKDEKFVQKLAEDLGVKFHSVKLNAEDYSREFKCSVQKAARDLRYDWLDKLSEDHHYAYIAVAHNKNDSAETFLLNIIRGTGITGLHGIIPKRGKVIRPLLFASREDIERYAEVHKIGFRTDSSNLSDKYTRNNLRLNIIPQLREINPNLIETITAEIDNFREVEQVYNWAIEQAKDQVLKKKGDQFMVKIPSLKKYSFARTLLYEIMKPFGFNSSEVEDIYTGLERQSGQQFLTEDHRAIIDRQRIIITKKPGKREEPVFIEREMESLQEPLPLRISILPYGGQFQIPKSPNIVCLDYSQLNFPLTIRKWKRGDCFFPFGMPGQKKKLSDFFIDQKFSLLDKENTWLLCSRGEIVWVIGHRIDERFKITDETRMVYMMRLQDEQKS